MRRKKMLSKRRRMRNARRKEQGLSIHALWPIKRKVKKPQEVT